MSLQVPLVMQAIVSGLNAIVMARYSNAAAYVVCFYDWIISLDQEVALIHPSACSAVKVAYLFCRYYPLAIAPFHLWGLLGDHDQRVCESYYHALYACTIPTMVSAHFILMLRTYAFSGRKKTVLGVLSITFCGLVGIIIWVISTKLTLTPIFIVVNRSACFAVSDQPVIIIPPVASTTHGVSEVKLPLAYFHLGLISILSASFDGLNMLIMIWRCIRERGTLGPLGQSFLKQGLLVYVVMTALNTLSIGTYFGPSISPELKGVGPGFASVIPSALTCRLVLMLRRKASPTETELRNEYSHMINEALEMIPGDFHREDTSLGITPLASISTDAQTLP
ncbi:hypothetical protein V8E53_006825 [Lactarius tabidus]